MRFDIASNVAEICKPSGTSQLGTPRNTRTDTLGDDPRQCLVAHTAKNAGCDVVDQ